jgi:hypothetical protein
VSAIWNAPSVAGSKKDKHLLTFWAFGQFPVRLSACVAFRQQLCPVLMDFKRFLLTGPVSKDSQKAQLADGKLT